MQKSQWLYPVLIVLAALLAFFLCLENNFVDWDDTSNILGNDIIRRFSLENTIQIFSTQWQGHYSRFNPLVFTVYSFLFHCNGYDPFVFHLVNVLFHLGCSLIVFYLTLLILQNHSKALLCALLFAVHPIHAEPVAWAAALMHLMYSFFYLLSLWMYGLGLRQSEHALKWNILAWTAFIFSAMSFSGGAFTLPLGWILMHYVLGRPLDRRRTFHFIAALLISLYLIYLTFYTAKNADILTNPYFNDQRYSLLERINLSSVSIFHYLYQLLLPYNFSIVYPTGYFFHGINVLWTLAGLVLVFLFFFRTSKRIPRLVRFGIVFFLLTIAPFLQIYSTSDSITNDRYAYLAAWGIFLILTEMIHQFLFSENSFLKNRRALLKTLVISCLIYLFVISWYMSARWKNSGTLWSNVIAQYPLAYPAYVARGKYYLDSGQNEKGLKDMMRAQILFEEAQKRKPQTPSQ